MKQISLNSFQMKSRNLAEKPSHLICLIAVSLLLEPLDVGVHLPKVSTHNRFATTKATCRLLRGFWLSRRKKTFAAPIQLTAMTVKSV